MEQQILLQQRLDSLTNQSADPVLTKDTHEPKAPAAHHHDTTYSKLGHKHPYTDLTAETKGDLLVCGDAGWQVLPVGADGRVLSADSAQALGMRWIAGGGGGGRLRRLPKLFLMLAKAL